VTRRLSLWVAACCLVLARSAQADEASDAEALFKEGIEAMRAENYDQACPKLQESYRLDPVPGALFTLAECEAARGKSATAIDYYQKFVNSLTSLPADRRDKFDERRRMALDKLAALSAVAPEVTVIVSSSAPAALVIKRNDVVIDEASYGIGKKVDQGEHVVTAEIDGKVLWTRRFTLNVRDRAKIEVPWPLGKSEPTVTETEAPEPPAAVEPREQAKGSSKTLVYVAGGIGIAGLTTGLIAGAVALGKKGDIEDHCPNRQCTSEGHDDVDSGQSAALVSSIGFGVGIAGAATAVALLLFTRSDPPRGDKVSRTLYPIVAAGDRGAGVGVRGSF